MKKRWGILVAVLGVCFCVGAPMGIADEGDLQPEVGVTHDQLAREVLDATGLHSFILSKPGTVQEVFSILLVNGISPAEGWKAGTTVTKADLARVIVQAMGKGHEVENPGDPGSWVAYLKENGYPIDSVEDAIANVGATSEPVAGYVFAAGFETDPAARMNVFGDPDEKQFGADVASDPVPAEMVAEIASLIDGVPSPPTAPTSP